VAMMQDWANYLDKLKAVAEVKPIREYPEGQSHPWAATTANASCL